MAPATVAGAARQAVTGRGRGWDRDSIIIAIQEWVATYGEPPRAADWNPSSAKWAGQLWRVERYRAGRADGSPWPALNSAKRPFGGSLNAAVRAAGLAPARPGPGRSAVEPEQSDRALPSAADRASLQVAAARRDAAAARDEVRRVAARLAEAEATISALRAGTAPARSNGPAGPATLAGALRALAAARRDAAGGTPAALQAALLDVATAALAWRERL